MGANLRKKKSLGHIRIVLVEPKQPGNIGSVARAMKNTGLSRLYLVNPPDHTCGEARMMAHGSGDILYGATVAQTLEEALIGTNLVVATSHRRRRDFTERYGPRAASEKLLALPEGLEGALVFGREESGLTNDEVQLCHIVSQIPSPVRYPSLNLSQAMLIFGYELYQATHNPPEIPELTPAPFEQLEAMYAHIDRSMRKLGFVSRNHPETFMRSIRRVFGRIPLERRDVSTIHKIFRQIDRFISRHGLDTQTDRPPK